MGRSPTANRYPPMFTELRTHSAFSFGDGACTPEALVARAAALGYGALGLTDRADLGGVIRFVLEAERRGIEPVIGAELLVDGRPAAFLARDEEGFHNLAGLVTRSRMGDPGRFGSDAAREPGPGRGSGLGVSESPDPESTAERMLLARPRGRPALTFADVAARSAGLYALTGPASGQVASLLAGGERVSAAMSLSRWKEVFGDRLAVEVQLHHVSGAESALAARLIELARASGVRWVATNDPRYLDAGGRLVHDLLTALRLDLSVAEAAEQGRLHPNGEWRLKGPGEMAVLWRGRHEGLQAASEIAGDCTFDLRWLRPPLPRFDIPSRHASPDPRHGTPDDSYLRELVFAGARERWGEVGEPERAQLEHELGVIRRLGFAGFFLVMWDAVRFARERGILCQGRGSAANSAVAYCLSITAVDPVKHGLLFERFLSEHRTDGRTEAPDIDVDFEMHRREEVLDYMYEKYARQHAAIACVTQTYHAPTAIQDVMRALGYEAEQAFRISKRLHGREPSDAAEALTNGLAAEHGLDLDEPRGRALLQALGALDDVPRLRSTHPGGFVLSREPLGEWMPIEHTSMGRTILQFDKDDLDAAGVPKFDFLGLGGLSAVHLAFDAIEQRTGEKLELYTLPTDDVATYEMISQGETVGTFQIESRAQIASILQTRPEQLYDIVVQVALIRPGPIQARFVRPYTRRRRGLEPIRYAHPDLEPILRRTYGIPIFQEQAMAISMRLGGFGAAEADELRRAMGNFRKAARLHAALEKLKARMVARGLAPDVAAEIAEDLHSFANYGFPESHAWSFALIAYATAYLKRHYPAEFALGMLNAWPMGFYPPATLVHDAMRNGVEIRPPCLKVGQWDCTLEEVDEGANIEGARGRVGEGAMISVTGAASPTRSAISTIAPSPPRPLAPSNARPALRVGWRHIRGLGEKAREALQAAHAEGPFTSVEDVVRRARLKRVDALHLARAGAFEAFEPGRRRAAWEALRAAGDVLPLAPARRLPFEPAELEGEELIFLDYLATGISVRGHPMQHLRERLSAAGVASSADLPDLADGERVVVAGLVVARQHPATAKGTVFLLLEDEFGFLNIIVPAPLYVQNREVVKFSPFLVVEGRFEREERVLNVVGRRFRELGVRDIAFRSHDFQ